MFLISGCIRRNNKRKTKRKRTKNK